MFLNEEYNGKKKDYFNGETAVSPLIEASIEAEISWNNLMEECNEAFFLNEGIKDALAKFWEWIKERIRMIKENIGKMFKWIGEKIGLITKKFGKIKFKKRWTHAELKKEFNEVEKKAQDFQKSSDKTIKKAGEAQKKAQDAINLYNKSVEAGVKAGKNYGDLVIDVLDATTVLNYYEDPTYSYIMGYFENEYFGGDLEEAALIPKELLRLQKEEPEKYEEVKSELSSTYDRLNNIPELRDTKRNSGADKKYSIDDCRKELLKSEFTMKTFIKKYGQLQTDYLQNALKDDKLEITPEVMKIIKDMDRIFSILYAKAFAELSMFTKDLTKIVNAGKKLDESGGPFTF